MNKKDRVDFPKIIRELRGKGLTYEKIAKQCGCSAGYMCQLGNGNKKEPGFHIGRELVRLHWGVMG